MPSNSSEHSNVCEWIICGTNYHEPKCVVVHCTTRLAARTKRMLIFWFVFSKKEVHVPPLITHATPTHPRESAGHINTHPPSEYLFVIKALRFIRATIHSYAKPYTNRENQNIRTCCNGDCPFRDLWGCNLAYEHSPKLVLHMKECIESEKKLLVKIKEAQGCTF